MMCGRNPKKPVLLPATNFLQKTDTEPAGWLLVVAVTLTGR